MVDSKWCTAEAIKMRTAAKGYDDNLATCIQTIQKSKTTPRNAGKGVHQRGQLVILNSVRVPKKNCKGTANFSIHTRDRAWTRKGGQTLHSCTEPWASYTGPHTGPQSLLLDCLRGAQHPERPCAFKGHANRVHGGGKAGTFLSNQYILLKLLEGNCISCTNVPMYHKDMSPKRQSREMRCLHIAHLYTVQVSRLRTRGPPMRIAPILRQCSPAARTAVSCSNSKKTRSMSSHIVKT